MRKRGEGDQPLLSQREEKEKVLITSENSTTGRGKNKIVRGGSTPFPIN